MKRKFKQSKIQYQQNDQLPLTSNHWTQKDHDIWHWNSRLRTDTKMWRGLTA